MAGRKRINILFVMMRMEMGGSERLIHNLARHLDRSRFNPSIAWFYGEEVLKEFSDLGIPLYFVPKRKRIDLFTMGKLAEIIRDRDIHVVNAHHFMPFVYSFYGAKLINRRKLFCTFHSEWEVRALPWKWRAAGGMLLRRLDGIIGVSREVTDLARDVFGLRPSKTVTMVNGVDVKAFMAGPRNDALRRTLKLDPQEKVVGAVANFKTVKNHLFLLEAFDALVKDGDNVRLLLIGRSFDDPDNTEPAIRRFIAERGLEDRVLLLGYRPDVPQLLQLMDVCCLTSFKEGLPISVIEAMAAGLPIVASDVEGIRDVVLPDQNGFLVRLGDVPALKNAVSRLLKDASLRARFGQRSRTLAITSYSLEHRLQEYHRLFSADFDREESRPGNRDEAGTGGVPL